MSTYCIITAFLNALAGVVLGLAVLLKGPRNRQNHLFAWFTVSFSAWSWFYVRWQLADTEQDALAMTRLLTGVSIFIPITYFHFVCRLSFRRHRVETAAGYLAALVISTFMFTPWLAASVEQRMMFPYWPVPGPAFYPYIAVFAYFTLRAWSVLFGAYRDSENWRHRQLGYVCIATIIGWAGGLTNFLLWFNIPIPPVGNGLALVYLGGVSYAMMRFRLVDVDEVIIRGIVYLLVVAVLGFGYFTLVSILPAMLTGASSQLIEASTYLAAFLVTFLMFMLIPRLRRMIDSFLEMRVLNVRGEARRQLRDLTARIPSIIELRSIFDEAAAAVLAAVDAGAVAVYVRDEFSSDLTLQTELGEQPAGGRPPVLTLRDGILCGVPVKERAVVLYENEQDLSEEDLGRVEAFRKTHLTELILPVSEGGSLHGLLLIGRSRDNRLFGDVDIALLESLGLRIALTIRARQLERQANHAEKLISLGTLAAGVAHELRNPLVSIRTFSALIEEQGADAEFRREFRGVVMRDVERIASIVDNVSAFADNGPVKFTPVNPCEVLRGVRDITAPDFRAAGVRLELPVDQHSLVSGNYSQLLQVFINLFQNALHALEGRPDACIRVVCRPGPRTTEGATIVIDVTDNGCGIDAAVRQRIFEPFVTTKATGDQTAKRGMGLGLAIVKRIVEAHHGSITVSAPDGGGTTFSVQLPRLK